MIYWRTLFFKSEQDCTLLLYKVSFHFCKHSLKFISPKLLFLVSFILFSHECSFFVSHTCTHIPTFLMFPHLYPIADALITILANNSGRLFNIICNSRTYKAFFFSFFPVKIISNIMVWSLKPQIARLLEGIREDYISVLINVHFMRVLRLKKTQDSAGLCKAIHEGLVLVLKSLVSKKP